MARKSKKNFHLIEILNDINISIPLQVWLIIISFIMTLLGFIFKDAKEFPEGNWKSFLNPLIRKLSEPGLFLFNMGVFLLILGFILLIYGIIKDKQSNIKYYD